MRLHLTVHGLVTCAAKEVHMVRPCFLVVDREFPGNISTRKLVLETAKYNVITVYSGREAIDTLRTFPNVTGVVLDTFINDMSCEELVKQLRTIRPLIPVVATQSPNMPECDGPTHLVPFYSPETLLETIAKIVPSETSMIRQHEIEIEKKSEEG